RRNALIRKCQMSLSALHVKWTPGKRMGLPTNEGHAMNVQSRTRTLAKAALVALLVASFGAAAAAPQPRDNQRQEHRKDQRQAHRNDRKDQRQERRDARKDQRQARKHQRQAERQREQAQHRYYQQRLSQPRVVHKTRVVHQPRVVHHTRVVHVPAYRYNYGGQWYSTSRYRADMLREAVRRGYQQGLRAGRADRHRRWDRGYRDSRMWIDASYGYSNDYVRRADYQHYFRQGFDRGYQDGYYGRQRYGRYDDRSDTAIIFTAVLAAILGL